MEGKKKPKERRRSNEKRKEKSRDAARCRRSRETDIFAELAAALPMPPDQAANLDKASVMRLAIAYLKVRSVVDALVVEPRVEETETVAKMNSLFPDALNGFMLVLSSNGDMVYLSENVSDYLGVSQIELMGQSVFEYSHPCDHAEIRDCLAIKSSDIDEDHACNFFLRLKCTLTSKGRKVNLKSASYKVIHCIGRPMLIREGAQQAENSSGQNDSSESGTLGSGSEDSQDFIDNEQGDVSNKSSGFCLVVVGCPIPHPSNIEVPLGHDTILSKHNLNMKFTYVDERLAEYLGWSNHELVGKSVFEFYHALDNSALDKSFKSLFSKGQCETMAYRFLGKTGGFAWVVTQATLIRCSKQQKPLSIVCVNYILSGLECKDEVYSVRQLEARTATETELVDKKEKSDKKEKDCKTNNNNNKKELEISSSLSLQQRTDEQAVVSPITDNDNNNIVIQKIIGEKRARPLAVTASIFKDRVPDKKDNSSINDITNIVDRKENTNKRSNWIYQDKLSTDFDTAVRQRGNRPQAVTRNLFGQQQENQQLSGPRPPPQTTTASIFAPRTEDMSKGFLTFSEDQPGLTMLKDEPEDLTHLAPTPGDVCVPLEDTPFISDMLDEFILGNEVYCPLLSPSLPPELHGDVDLTNDDTLIKDPDCISDTIINTTIVDSDPFFYRDTSSSPGCCLSNSSDLLTPILGKSPESIDSLYSPDDNDSSNALGSGISDDDMLMLNINDVIADEELALRAPYIPMSDQDEALQLLISDDMVMWGPSQPADKRDKWNNEDENTKRYADSSLAKLLKSTSDDIDKRSIESFVVDPVQVLGQTCKKGTSNKRHHGTVSSTGGGESKRIRCQDTTRIDETIPALVLAGNKNYSMREIFTGSTTTTTTTTTTKMTGSGDDEVPDDCRDTVLDDDEGGGDVLREMRNQGNKQLLEQLMGQCGDKVKHSNDKRRDKNNRQEYNDDDGGGDRGEGGGGKKSDGKKYPDNGKRQQQQQQQSNSVLMNLLVSGCDTSSINMPRQLENNYSPLSISVEEDSYIQQQEISLTSPYLSMNNTINELSPCIKSNIGDISPLLLNPSYMNDDFNNYTMMNVTDEPLSPGTELLRALGQAN